MTNEARRSGWAVFIGGVITGILVGAAICSAIH